MKKRYILTFLIPIILAAIIALILTPSAKDSCVKNLTKFNNLPYVYYTVQINTPEGEQQIQQYKAGDVYLAKYYIGKEPLMIIDKKGSLRFGVNSLAVSSSVEDSKAANSVFWLDKLSVDDIDKNSIKRVSESNENKFSAKLNNGTDIELIFDKAGMVSKIVYKNISYLLQLYPLNSVQKESIGDVEVIISNYNVDGQVDPSYKLPDEKQAISYEEFLQALQDDNIEEGLEEDFSQLKSALGIGEEFIDNEEDEYDEEENVSNEEEQSLDIPTEDFQNKLDISEDEFNSQRGNGEKEVPPDFELME